MNAAIRRHCGELDRCNQRGGRMLSVFDLLEAGTIPIDLAAYLMARITRGASFLVGAQPGGAGKTTVMCALLNLVPEDVELTAATAMAVLAARDEAGRGRRCYICHEIGSGPYFAYLWGSDLRAYCALAEQGHMLATNLHADDLDEAHGQICVENGVSESHFRAFHLQLFLRVEGRFRSTRIVDKVYASDGASPHRLVFDARRSGLLGAIGVDGTWSEECRGFLKDTHAAGTHTIEDTRTAVLEFLAKETR